MELPDDDNVTMLAAMSDAGMDLSLPTDIDFFLVFDGQRDAETALEDLVNSDLEGEVELLFNEETAKWELIVGIKMVPEYDTIIAQEAALNGFAEEYDGISDGWGVMQQQEGDTEFADEDEHECSDTCSH
ncbi:MAG: ribonuclease E inhibitor RraB [Shewanella sp.]|nr:ribonuclease E inhibitor RraB [Shewanella sp.]